ncbi:MAG: hypothetical protein IT373_15255 [Polyangiaceae bacterium]|nr:hypothetical protein [Polyangiaceae bacterium]
MCACKGDKNSDNVSAASTAPTGTTAAAAPALPPIPALAASQVAEAQKDHYAMRSGPWGSVLVPDDWTADTGTGGYVHIKPDDLKWPAEAIHVKVVKRTPGAKVAALVKEARPPAGYDAEESVREDPPWGLEKAGLEFAYKNITNYDVANSNLNERAGQIAALGRGDTVYVITCYAAASSNSSGNLSSRTCFNAFYSFRPPANG